VAAPENVVTLAEKYAQVRALWSPHAVAEFNGLHVKLARVHGEFVWHTHEDTDEVFLVNKGVLTVELKGRDAVTLQTGDMFVVPAGVEHRPTAEHECEILLIEPAGTPNTGDEATAVEVPWL